MVLLHVSETSLSFLLAKQELEVVQKSAKIIIKKSNKNSNNNRDFSRKLMDFHRPEPHSHGENAPKRIKNPMRSAKISPH